MSKRRVVLAAAGLALLYLLIQAVYITRLPLVMDEFDGANEAYQLLELTPYKDYRPYKTVLGYYAQLPPVLATSDPWTGVMLSKFWAASINTVSIFAATIALARIFSAPAALIGTLLLVFVTTFLERSSEIRVDMLTAWAGLASLLFLLERRWVAAGVLAGLSFLISQKGLYYIVAAGAAGGVYWLVESRTWRTFANIAVVGVAAAVTIAVYVLLWGMVSSPSAVFNATFLSHTSIVWQQMYQLEEHWTRTLTRNPWFYWGAVAAMGGLAIARWRGHAGANHVLVAVYGAAMFALCRWHKQPWPYFFVLLIPTLMVVHVAALDLIWRAPRLRKVTIVAIALLGIAWPLTYMPRILARDLSYQRHVIRFAHAMLDERDTYLAGNDLIYNRRQAPAALRRLSAYQLDAMKTWPADRFDPLIAEIEAARPKLLINDYRMRLLPAPLRRYLATRFDPLWSSIHAYAPLVEAGDAQIDVWFDGNYAVEATDRVSIDGSDVAAGSVVALRRGAHRIASAAPVRLRLQPAALADYADPSMKEPRLMFAQAYDY